MPPQRNKVYRLAKEQELSYDEIAYKLGISKNAVKKHLKIAFKFMKERLRHLRPAIVFIAIWHLFN
jgi:RNA polymerase sigma-70 factor (ECF subfamily)